MSLRRRPVSPDFKIEPPALCCVALAGDSGARFVRRGPRRRLSPNQGQGGAKTRYGEEDQDDPGRERQSVRSGEV